MKQKNINAQTRGRNKKMSANVIATTASDKPKVKVTVYMTDLGDAFNCDIEYDQSDDIDIAHILDGFSFDFLTADLFDDGNDTTMAAFDEVNFDDKIDCGYFNDVIVAMKDNSLIPATYDEYRLEIDADDYVRYLTWRADYYGDAREHIEDGESVRCDLAAPPYRAQPQERYCRYPTSGSRRCYRRQVQDHACIDAR